MYIQYRQQKTTYRIMAREMGHGHVAPLDATTQTRTCISCTARCHCGDSVSLCSNWNRLPTLVGNSAITVKIKHKICKEYIIRNTTEKDGSRGFDQTGCDETGDSEAETSTGETCSWDHFAPSVKVSTMIDLCNAYVIEQLWFLQDQ